VRNSSAVYAYTLLLSKQATAASSLIKLALSIEPACCLELATVMASFDDKIHTSNYYLDNCDHNTKGNCRNHRIHLRQLSWIWSIKVLIETRYLQEQGIYLNKVNPRKYQMIFFVFGHK